MTAEQHLAQQDLLQHLAMMGELADRLEIVGAEFQALQQRFAQARARKAGLVQAVLDSGGQLPHWSI